MGVSCKRIRILLAVEHALVRESIATSLSLKAGFDVVASVGSGNAVMDAFAVEQPDITLLDVRLPHDEGFSTIERLRSRYPKPAIIMLAGNDMPYEVSRARDLGARGLISKKKGVSSLCSAIEKVYHGQQAWFQPAPNAEQDESTLSSREIQVLEGARCGHSNADIGRALHISEHTVKSHIRSILQKLHASDRAEAVARGFELGILY